MNQTNSILLKVNEQKLSLTELANTLAQSAWAVEYIDCTSAEG